MCENLTALLVNTSSKCDVVNLTISKSHPGKNSMDTSEILNAFYLNASTVAFHIVAFMFIVFPASVKPSLRIFLVSLSLPGFVQNLAWATARGATLKTGHALVGRDNGCKVLTFFTQLGILCHQTTVTALAVNNYLAVSYPILFKQWTTPLKTMISVTSIWTVWALFSLLDTGTRENSMKPCWPLVVSPIFLLITEAVVIILTSLIVAVLNIAVIFKLKQRLKIHPSNRDQIGNEETNTRSTTEIPERPNTNSPSASTGKSIFTIPEEGSDAEGRTSAPTVKERPALVMTTASGSTLSVPNHPRHLLNKNPTIRCVTPVPQSASTPVSSASGSIGPEPESTPPSQMESTVGRSSNQSSSSGRWSRAEPQHACRSRVHKTAVTLILLSVWNSLGQLPFMACVLVAVVNRGNTPTWSISALNSISGLIARISTIGNTFIYAWRFIKWRSVLDRIKRSKILCR